MRCTLDALAQASHAVRTYALSPREPSDAMSSRPSRAIGSPSQTSVTRGPISSPACLSWYVSPDNAAACTTSSTSSLRPWPWRRPPSWPWSGGGPAPAQCGAQHRAWQQCGSSMPMPPGGRTVRVYAICRLADARRRAAVLLYLQRVDHARCRGCCEAQPVRGIDATEDAGLARHRVPTDAHLCLATPAACDTGGLAVVPNHECGREEVSHDHREQDVGGAHAGDHDGVFSGPAQRRSLRAAFR